MAIQKLRVGIIGANINYGWGPRAHLPALVAMPDVDLVAVCTAHEDTAKESADKYGVPMAFHDHHEMLKRDDIDAVGVIVRVPLHHELTMDVLAAGKHVYTDRISRRLRRWLIWPESKTCTLWLGYKPDARQPSCE